MYAELLATRMHLGGTMAGPQMSLPSSSFGEISAVGLFADPSANAAHALVSESASIEVSARRLLRKVTPDASIATHCDALSLTQRVHSGAVELSPARGYYIT